MGRTVEVDLFELINLWEAVNCSGIHRSDIANLLPVNITPEELEEYCIQQMPVSSGYTVEDDWDGFRQEFQEEFLDKYSK